MKAEKARVGAVALDSLPFSMGGSAGNAAAWKAAGVSCFVGYLGVINQQRLGYVLQSGLAFMPVTLAGEHFDGPADEIRQLVALGIPSGATVWLDLEGQKAFRTPPSELIDGINKWGDAIRAAGYMPGLYVGVPQPLRSDELWALRVERYWRGQGSIRDRENKLAEPTKCGWTMTQMYPPVHAGGVLVDFNIIGQDYLRRVPNWVVSDVPPDAPAAPDLDAA